MKKAMAIFLALLMSAVMLPAAADTVTIIGSAVCGGTLSVSLADQSAYLWYAAEAEDGTYAAITGAKAATYTVTREFIGHYIKCAVTTSGGVMETAPVKIRGEINETARIDFNDASGLSAFEALKTGLNMTVTDGIAYFDGNGVDFGGTVQRGVNVAKSSGFFSSLVNPDIYVAEARVGYDITNSRQGGLSFQIHDAAGYKYRIQYATGDSPDKKFRALASKVYADSGVPSAHIMTINRDIDGTGGGKATVVRVATDVAEQKVYVYANDVLYGTINCNEQGIAIASPVEYAVEIVGSTTYVDYVRFYGLSDPDTTTQAKNVKLRGYAAAGRKLRAEFSYYNADGVAAGTPTYQWYSAGNAVSSFTAIAGAEAAALPIGTDLIGKYVKCVITPYSIEAAGKPSETSAVRVAGTEKVVSTVNFDTAQEVSDNFTVQNDLVTTGISAVEGETGNNAAIFTKNGSAAIGRTTTVAKSVEYPVNNDDADVMVLETRVKYTGLADGGGAYLSFGTANGWEGKLLYTKNTDGTTPGAQTAGNVVMYASNASGTETNPRAITGSIVSDTISVDKYVTIAYVINRALGLVEARINGTPIATWNYNDASGTAAGQKTALTAKDFNIDFSGGGYKFRVDVRGNNTGVDYIKVKTYSGGALTLDVVSSAFGAESLTAGSLGGSVHAINYGTAAKPLTVIMAAYAGDLVTDLVIETVYTQPGEGDTALTKTLNITAEVTRAAIFVWDDISTMVPYIPATNLYHSDT